MAMGAALRGVGLTATAVSLGIIGTLALIGWAGMARVIRGQVLAIREMDFVTAAKAAGANDLRVTIRHIIPNVMTYLVVNATAPHTAAPPSPETTPGFHPSPWFARSLSSRRRHRASSGR